MPKVSVCIPTYNGAPFLEACLSSVLSQTYKDIEILIVDDGSTDSTVAILERHALADQRIRFLHNEHNLGLVGNWNRCFELAQGEWIKFVFQDDLLRHDCLEKMLATASRPLILCRREFLFAPGTDKETLAAYAGLPDIPRLIEDCSDIDSVRIQDAVLYEKRNFFGEPTAALLHRSLFQRFGLFNVDLAQFCDLEYWIRTSINTGLVYIDEPLAIFRYHSSSTSANNRDRLNDERVSVFDRLVLEHEFAYNPHYAALQIRAREKSPKRNFKREFARKALWTYARAKSLASRPEEADNSWMERWNELAARYPRFEYSLWHLPYQMRDLWQRRIGWRFKG